MSWNPLSWVEDILDFGDEVIGQPINNFVQQYEQYIPTVAGWVTGMPWLGTAWNYANMDDAQQKSGLASFAAKAAASNLAKDFFDVSSSFDGVEGVTDIAGVPVSPTDWFSAYDALDTPTGLDSIFGTPEVTGVKDWTGYDTSLRNLGEITQATPSTLDPVFQNTSAGVGSGQIFNTSDNIASKSFTPDVSSYTGPSDADVVGSNMDTSLLTDQVTPTTNTTLENVTEGGMSLPRGMSSSSVLDQTLPSIREGSSMNTLKDLWKTVNSPIGGVEGAPSWLKAAKGAGQIYGGLQTDRLNREAQQMYRDMYDKAISTSDPFAADRALASNKWQEMVRNPAAGWDEYAAGIAPEMAAASRKLAGSGRRSQLPFQMAMAKQKYMGDVKNRLAAYNPAQFGTSGSSSVSSAFAPGMAALKMKEGAGLPTALASIGQEMINPKSLADLFSRFTKPSMDLSNWDTNFSMDMI